MTDRHEELDVALERVIAAARGHLAAVQAAEGRTDDDDVWQAYVALNNASFEYDEALLEHYGEVTPWDVEAIDPDEADRRFGVGLGGVDGTEPTDPHPTVVSVRQRRDYRVPSTAALLRIAQAARTAGSPEDVNPEPGASVGEAVLELLQTGDGSLGTLDVPELQPLDGVVTVTEVAEPLDLDDYPDDEGEGPFRFGPGDRLVGRLDEHPFLMDDEAEDDDHEPSGRHHRH
jgi:hypothetical protein